MQENEDNKLYETYEFTQGNARIIESVKPKESKVGKFFRNILVVASMGLIFGICGGLGLKLVEITYPNEQIILPVVGSVGTEVPTIDVTSENKTVLNTLTDNSYTQVNITEMIKNTMPAMVSIESVYKETVSYFGKPITQEGVSNGSGIIVAENDSELLMVTNHHVISDASEIRVVFVDGNSSIAQVKGSDVEMDLAILAIQLDDMDYTTRSEIAIAPLGNSEQLQLGEYVVAIGNALGYGQSVTDGIVSALNREIETEEGYNNSFIQTNAEINFGNSGGALLNAKGEVVGINSNKLGGDSVEGMGYAIPISAAKPIIEDLMLKETKVKVDDANRGYIGITYTIVDTQTAQMYGWETGLYVRSVDENGPADMADIRQGDIILSINGTRVNTEEQLTNVMQYCAAGENITIELVRQEGKEFVLKEFTFSLARR